ncbi:MULTISPECIES: prolyl oligopeptidase family serine peptidase [unclassified Massilia]|uniref:dipeptidyl-peptidase 5 n=1 Tax=unclassified Massilia TaxID=2609279 RepID=UPI00177DF840|nr:MULTISPECIES: prolyl oligopeptidase family serine peptidase [unclassified Massilia]MBD8532025.1 S9 family peptidase [Massilia sp. CFBP 13647]MBD8675471.1 S9 family peptidase [Massilia sp. CFBP 13721]
MTEPTRKQAAPSGTWTSPISAAVVAAGAVPLSQIALDGRDVLWLAGRASEAGRTTLQRLRAGATTEVTPAPFNVRTRVHEYGGGAYAVDGGTVWFSHFADNHLYMVEDGAEPVVITREEAVRYADFVPDRARSRLVAVREDHLAGEAYPVNTICAVGFDGVETILVDGNDFYAAPRLSPDGRQLAWLCWDHPRMPWQGTELWVADIAADGTLVDGRLVAGGLDESICQPEWSPGGLLHFVSDRSGWWNLYRFEGGVVHPLCPREAEFGGPQWNFGGSMYGFRSDDEIICTYIEDGISRLGRLATRGCNLEPIDTPYQEIKELRVSPDAVLVLAGSPTIALELALIEPESGQRSVLVQSIADLPDTAYLSVPHSIRYPSMGGRSAYAFYYAPANGGFELPGGELSPLIVIGHGGPTSMATSTLKLATQFWTSRGFAVLDVNYGGSSGFGRIYRDLLKGQWGVIDVEDCVAGARHLAEQGAVDPERLLIRGSSAGGLTTLNALTFHDVFKAGASYYGVSDLAGLDADSHKFESHYNEYLIAPKAQAQAVYRERSPIHHTDALKRPMIFFQGLDDKVVPPQQSETMVDALRARGVPVAYLMLEGEGHGFRKAESVVRTLEAELAFYLRVFGIALPEGLPQLEIENLAA